MDGLWMSKYYGRFQVSQTHKGFSVPPYNRITVFATFITICWVRLWFAAVIVQASLRFVIEPRLFCVNSERREVYLDFRKTFKTVSSKAFTEKKWESGTDVKWMVRGAALCLDFNGLWLIMWSSTGDQSVVVYLRGSHQFSHCLASSLVTRMLWQSTSSASLQVIHNQEGMLEDCVPFREISPGCRNGLAGTFWSSSSKSTENAWEEEQRHASVGTGGSPVTKQMVEGDGGADGHQDDHEPTTYQCDKEGQHLLGCIRKNTASKLGGDSSPLSCLDEMLLEHWVPVWSIQ